MSIESFFNKVGAVARRTADAVANDVNIAAEEQKVRDAYRDLGKLYYQAVQTSTLPAGKEFDAQVLVIQEGLEKINQLRQKNRVD